MTSINHLGTKAFEEISGEVVQSVAYALRKTYLNDYVASFIKLDDVDKKQNAFHDDKRKYNRSLSSFDSLPDSIFAYWLSNSVLDSFKKYEPASKIIEGKIGLQTGDNTQFLRLWYEIDSNKIGIYGLSNEKYWAPYNKAGSYRRWYGNNDYVVNWYDNGYDIINCRDENGRLKSRPQNRDYYFKSGSTWSDVCTGLFSMRYMPKNFIFDSCAPSVFGKRTKYILGIYNTKVAQLYLDFLAPTIHYTCGSVLKMPIIDIKGFDDGLVDDCISITKNDWDAFETSWDFKTHPLI